MLSFIYIFYDKELTFYSKLSAFNLFVACILFILQYASIYMKIYFTYSNNYFFLLIINYKNI